MTASVPDTVAPSAGLVRPAVGGVVSEGGALLTLTVTATAVPVFPAASRARAESVCVPLPVVVVSHESEYGADVSSPPRATPSNRNWTPATAVSSFADPETETTPATNAPSAGDTMDAAGGVVSGGGGGTPPSGVAMSDWISAWDNARL